jgi:hypothetical protein
MPGTSPVGADLEGGDRLIGVDDLHGEPVRRGSLLVLQDEGRVDVARDEGPVNADDALGESGELAKAVLEEVEMGCFALGALVDDLCCVSVVVRGRTGVYAPWL